MRTYTFTMCLALALLSTPGLSMAQDAVRDTDATTEAETPAETTAAEETETAAEETETSGGEDASTTADAEVSAAADAPSAGPAYMSGVGLTLGAKLGAGFGQLTSPLGSTLLTELELGYLLPFANRSLQLFVAGSYAAPSTEETVATPDPRLPGVWSYKLTLQQLNITPGLLFRVPLESPYVRPYVAAGARIGMTRTEVSGEAAGELFGGTEETATSVGGYGALGLDIFLGPGALLLETQFGYNTVDGYILRNTNSGSLNLALGYRLFL